MTSFHLPTSNTAQTKDDVEQSNTVISEDDKLVELSAVLGDDVEVMDQIKKMLNSQGHDLEFVSLKVMNSWDLISSTCTKMKAVGFLTTNNPINDTRFCSLKRTRQSAPRSTR